MIKILSMGNNYIKKGIHSFENTIYIGGFTNSPMETYNYIIKHRPDVIVMAPDLGDLEAVTVCRRIRNMYAGKYIPMILLVHEEDESLYDDFYDDGITIGLSRDVKEDILFLHINQLIMQCKIIKKIVLVLDEDPVIQNTYQYFLENQYQVIKASSIQEAVNYLMSDSIDAIILGIMMPPQKCIIFLSILNENDVWKDIPVILQMDKKHENLITTFTENGVTTCLNKPISKEDLVECLEKLLYPEEVSVIMPKGAGLKRILHIDNIGVHYHSVKKILIGHYEQIHAFPGVRPIALLESEEIDAIILNLDNGLFCFNRILERASMKNIPILLLSSKIDEMTNILEEKRREFEVINCIIELPVSKHVLLDKLELAI